MSRLRGKCRILFTTEKRRSILITTFAWTAALSPAHEMNVFPPGPCIFIRIVVSSLLKLMRYPILSHWRSPRDLGVLLTCFLFPEVINGEQLRGRSFLVEELNPLGSHSVAQAIGPGWHFMGLYWHKEMWTTFMTVHLSNHWSWLIFDGKLAKAINHTIDSGWGYWHCSSSTSSTIMASWRRLDCACWSR